MLKLKRDVWSIILRLRGKYTTYFANPLSHNLSVQSNERWTDYFKKKI